MPMRYEGYVNPHAGTIADLLRQRGDIAARSAENIGGINARAAEQRGAAWAGAAQNIGQIAAGIPMQIQKQRELDAVTRERAARARESEQRTRLERESDIAGKQGAAALAESIQRHRTDEGVDFSAVAADIAAIDPDAATKFQTLADKTSDSRKKLREARTALARESNRISAEMAANASDPGDFLATVGMYHADELIDDDTVKKLSELVQSAGAEGWEPLKAKIVQGSPEFAAQQLKKKGEEADIAQTEAQTGKLEAEVAGTLPATPAQKETARHNHEMESIGRMTAGRAAAAQRETARHNKALEDLQKNRTGGLNPEMPSAFQTAVSRATMSIPMYRRGTVMETVNRLYAEGDEAGIKGVIRQAAIESENVDTKNQVLGRIATLEALRDTRAMIEEMQAQGIPTNILRGTAEDVARKLGKSTNPEYVKLGNRLMGTLISYRRAATGVQFSMRESLDYQRMFPNYRNDLPVNLALIEGLEREIATNDKTYWEHKLGPEGAALVGMTPGKAEADEGWTDLGNGVRIREKR